MTKPLVSIVTPAYNAEAYLEDAIKSVSGQTYENWELIVVDDGSTDATAEIAKAYAGRDQRIFYYRQENQRMASARNTGIRHARGEYVAFLDADNVFLPDKLETQVLYLETHPECGVCYGRILNFFHGKPNEFYDNPQPTPSGNIFPEVLRRNFINVLMVLVRREVLNHYGSFPQGWPACDEQYLWVNLAYHGVVFSYVDSLVGLLRLHPAEDSRRPAHLLDTARSFLRLLDMLETWFSEEEKFRYSIEIARLRQRWRKLLFFGILLAQPPTSLLLMPIYRLRRDRQYRKIKDVGENHKITSRLPG